MPHLVRLRTYRTCLVSPLVIRGDDSTSCLQLGPRVRVTTERSRSVQSVIDDTPLLLCLACCRHLSAVPGRPAADSGKQAAAPLPIAVMAVITLTGNTLHIWLSVRLQVRLPACLLICLSVTLGDGYTIMIRLRFDGRSTAV